MFREVDEAWGRQFGRLYGAIESYRCEGADAVLVTSGTITSTAHHVVNQRRARGDQVGLVKVKMFRPFPTALLREALAGVANVAVLDRNISPGHGGIFAEEIRAALYDLPAGRRPRIDGYIVGLGGRDVTPAIIEECLDRTLAGAAATVAATEAPRARKPAAREDLWVGVKP